MLQAHVGKAKDPAKILLVSIRARFFSVVSARVKAWRKLPSNPAGLPYHPFGQALTREAHVKSFFVALACYGRLKAAPLTVSRR